MHSEKLKMIETLTGVRSSKKNYYVELQKKIEEVTLRNKQLEIINRLAKSFNLDLPIESIITCLVEKLITVLQVDDFSLSMFLDGECKSILGKPGGGCRKTKSCTPNGVCRYIIKNKKSLILPDDAKELGFIVTKEVCPGSAVFIPLRVKDRVIGILSINSKNKGAYSVQDVEFLLQLGEHLATGLTNRKLFSEVLKREKEWADTFGAVTDAIIIIDNNYKIRMANERAKNLIRLPEKEAASQKCYEVIHKRTAPCETCLMLSESKDVGRTYQFVKGEDKEFYDVYTYPMFDEKGQVRGVFESFKDVTQRVLMESQLVQSEKLAAIGKLAAGVAHELNSPLTAILGNAQLLLRDFSSADENHILVEDIKQCGVRCKNIILNLLSFARQQQLEGESVSINDVVSKAVRLVGHQIRQDQIELICEMQGDLPNITGSGQQLEQVIINLLINAKDALDGKTDEKKIIISSGLLEKDGQEYLSVSVRDNGCGIDSEHLSEIFTPFYSTKEVGKGTGLGLSVSLGLIQNHGGTIECESLPESGAIFTILLPVR
jgi:two-component system NtrC family sensor kinase